MQDSNPGHHQKIGKTLDFMLNYKNLLYRVNQENKATVANVLTAIDECSSRESQIIIRES